MSEVNKKGLTLKEVEESRRKNGKNEIPVKDPVKWWSLLLEKFEDSIIQLLLMAVVFSVIGAVLTHEPLYDCIGIIMAVGLAVGIGFANEFSAAKKFEKQNQLSGDFKVPVYRDGCLTQVLKSELVVGDLVVLESGMEIPADCKVIEGECQVDESAVTGENVPVVKTPRNYIGDHTYSENVLVGSTPIVVGRVEAKVISVGIDTEAGRIKKATEVEATKSPLEVELDTLAELIAKLAFGGAGILFVALNAIHFFRHGFNSVQFLFAISLLVLIYPVIRNTYKGIEPTKLSWFLSASAAVLINIYGLSSPNFIIQIKDVLESFMVALTLIVLAVPGGFPLL